MERDNTKTVDSHISYVRITDSEVQDLVSCLSSIKEPALSVVYSIIEQANNSPIFCGVYNRPIRYMNSEEVSCNPFPQICFSCPFAFYEE